MQFAVVRGSSPICEPNCPEWISAEGKITVDTASRVEKFLKTVGTRRLPVIIQSPGGSIDAALKMGRIIRARGLDVAVGYTVFASCAPRQKGCEAAKSGGYRGMAAAGFAYCYSACPLVLAGGARRLVGSWAQLGVHQVTTVVTQQKVVYRTTTRIVDGKKVVTKKIVSRKNAGSYTTTKMGKDLRRKITAYLTEMGVSTDLLEPINRTAASDILQLNQGEMLALNLITSLDQVDVLTRPSICKAQPLPESCREIPVAETAATSQPAAKPAGIKFSDTRPAPAEQTGIKRTETTPAKTSSAAAMPAGPMRFAVVRSSGPLCDPDCPEWISAEGIVTSETPERLRKLLVEIGDRKLPLLVSSPGGDLIGALAVGRLIREHKLDVAIARTQFAGCTPQQEGCAAANGTFQGTAVDVDAECRSACSLVLAGGIRRLVGPRAIVTVHSMGLERRVADFLDEMAISRQFFVIMQSTMYSKHLQLEPDGMLKLGLTTGLEAADELTAPTICKSVSRPGNCRLITTADLAH